MYLEKSIVAKLYPKRIIIFTRLGDIHGSTWTESNCLTILPANISDSELGTVALKHLMLSKLDELTIDERWDLRDGIKLEIPATLTPFGHSFLRLNQRGGRGSMLVDFPGCIS